VAIAQSGKAGFLKHRLREIDGLVRSGLTVCTVDVRGTGELALPGSRYPRGPAASLASTRLMLGETTLGTQLHDLRSILSYLRARPEFADSPLLLWGDAFTPPNPADTADPPMNGDAPLHAEPVGGLLALLGALFEPSVAAVLARGCVSGFRAALEASHVYWPPDSVVPGAAAAGDLPDVCRALAPRPVCLECLVDGRNVALSDGEANNLYCDAPSTETRASMSDRVEWLADVATRTG